jgi:hypothetical protein
MTYTHASRHLLAALVSGVLLAPVTLADPPTDKGKGAPAAQAAADKGKSAPAAAEKGNAKGNPSAAAHDHEDDKGKADESHGQVVSDCNHRANEKNLKGHDRQDYIGWCTDRGERYQYDDRRYDQDRGCYRRAEERGLSGDFRRVFIQDCLRKQEKNR